MGSLYSTEISRGSLLIPESRKVAKILLAGLDSKSFRQEIVHNNILQKKTPATAIRQVRIIKSRLNAMPYLLRFIAEGDKIIATQALFACAIKHSQLLGDFLDRVIKVHVKTFNNRLSRIEWDSFLEECENVDESLKKIAGSSKKKAGQVVFRILAEANFIDNTRSLYLTPTLIFPEIQKILEESNERYVLKCLSVFK